MRRYRHRRASFASAKRPRLGMCGHGSNVAAGRDGRNPGPKHADRRAGALATSGLFILGFQSFDAARSVPAGRQRESPPRPGSELAGASLLRFAPMNAREGARDGHAPGNSQLHGRSCGSGCARFRSVSATASPTIPRLRARCWVSPCGRFTRPFAGARSQWGVARGQCGAVTFVQRFADALNLDVHFHALLLDGIDERGPHRHGPPGGPARAARGLGRDPAVGRRGARARVPTLRRADAAALRDPAARPGPGDPRLPRAARPRPTHGPSGARCRGGGRRTSTGRSRATPSVPTRFRLRRQAERCAGGSGPTGRWGRAGRRGRLGPPPTVVLA